MIGPRSLLKKRRPLLVAKLLATIIAHDGRRIRRIVPILESLQESLGGVESRLVDECGGTESGVLEHFGQGPLTLGNGVGALLSPLLPSKRVPRFGGLLDKIELCGVEGRHHGAHAGDRPTGN